MYEIEEMKQKWTKYVKIYSFGGATRILFMNAFGKAQLLVQKIKIKIFKVSYNVCTRSYLSSFMVGEEICATNKIWLKLV